MSLIGSLSSGVSALDAFEKGIEVIGNNIANINTTGYKNETTDYSDSFSNLLQQSTPAPAGGSGSNTNGMQVGTGVQIASISSNFGQGTLASTGVPSDLAIAGNGFFTVTDPVSGTNYVTRAGNFTIDSAGNLVTNKGYAVQGLTGGTATYSATDVNGALTYTQTATPPATIGNININYAISVGNGLTNDTGGAFTNAQVNAAAPSLQSFAVDPSGNVVLTLSNGDTVTAGRILLQNFSDPDALMSQGNNLYSNMSTAGPTSGSTSLSAAANSPGTNGLGSIQAGALEQSNVDLSSEFAKLITSQRSFQAGARLVTVSDTILEEVVNLKQR